MDKYSNISKHAQGCQFLNKDTYMISFSGKCIFTVLYLNCENLYYTVLISSDCILWQTEKRLQQLRLGFAFTSK